MEGGEVSEEAVREALSAKGVDTLMQFKLRYAREIVEMLQRVSRPKTVRYMTIVNEERQREYDLRREQAVAAMWLKYRGLESDRIRNPRRESLPSVTASLIETVSEPASDPPPTEVPVVTPQRRQSTLDGLIAMFRRVSRQEAVEVSAS